MTAVRLALGGPPELLKRALAPNPRYYKPPHILVSYVYLPLLDAIRDGISIESWSMDSGAFSAKKSGKVIDIEEYMQTCRDRMANDPQLTEVFALDVIGDHEGSAQNHAHMTKAGIKSMPVYHIGEPWEALEEMARTSDKIAVGGMTVLRGKKKLKFAEQCFARVWPKKVHGLGAGTEEMILSLPWHSVDASSWELGPCAFGTWKNYGHIRISTKAINLCEQVKQMLDIQQKAEWKWAKELAAL